MATDQEILAELVKELNTRLAQKIPTEIKTDLEQIEASLSNALERAKTTIDKLTARPPEIDIETLPAELKKLLTIFETEKGAIESLLKAMQQSAVVDVFLAKNEAAPKKRGFAAYKEKVGNIRKTREALNPIGFRKEKDIPATFELIEKILKLLEEAETLETGIINVKLHEQKELLNTINSYAAHFESIHEFIGTVNKEHSLLRLEQFLRTIRDRLQ